MHLADLVGAQGDVFAAESAQHGHLVVAFDDEAAERAAVVRLDHLVLVAFADFRVGVDDAEEHRPEVVALVGGEIGAEVAAFEEQLVAGGAAGGESCLSGVRIAGPGLQGRRHCVDAGLKISRRSLCGKQACGAGGDVGISVQAQPVRGFGGNRARRQRSAFQRVEQGTCPRGAAGERANRRFAH